MVREKSIKTGVTAFVFCYLIWGFQPLYWNICNRFDTSFIMAWRIIWAAAACVSILAVQGKLPQLMETFRSREIMIREIPAAVFLLADWVIYLYACRNGRIFECSLGYYILPLVVFLFGATIFREKIGKATWLALAFVVVGIVICFDGFGHSPWVVVTLALSFAIYSAVKKSLTTDSVVSTTCEILILVPAAVLYLLFFGGGDTGMGAMTAVSQLYLIGSGLVTGLPLVFYSIGVFHLPLTAVGLFEYCSPTMAIFCGMVTGEALTGKKLISFFFIWTGILIFVLSSGLLKKKSDSVKD